MTSTPAPPRPENPWPTRIWLWAPVTLYCAMIFAFSSVSDVPALPGGMSDKFAHSLLYSGLGFLVARALTRGSSGYARLWLAVAAIVATTAYGLSDETHQLFVPQRTFDLRDLVADFVGATVGTGAHWLWGMISGRG